MKTFILLTLLFLTLLSQPVAAQGPRSSPAQTANEFYRRYLKHKIRGLPNEKQLEALSPLMTADLTRLFEAARSTQSKFVQEHPDEKPPWADGDLFTSLFEGAQSFRVGRPKVMGDRAEVPVRFVYQQGGSTTRWSDVLVLVRTARKWLVSDIQMKGEWAFKSGASLRTILSDN